MSYSLIQEYAFFDSARQKAVLITSIPPNNSFLQCATWEFDSATLTWSAGPSGNIGFAFAGTAFTYDPVRHFAVGQSWPSYPYDPSMAQTWSRTDGAWTNLGITAPPNFSSIMAFDTTRRLSVLYGSNRGTYPGVPTDTWGFDGSTWRQLLPNLNAADPLEPTELVYDSARRAMVMVGVTYFESFDTVPMETWEYRYLDHVVIDRQPRATPVVLGQPAALSVYAAGAGTLGYQWRRNGVNLNDGPGPGGSTIAGSHSPALAINLFSASNDGDYDCVISNLCGNLTSSIAHLGSVGDFNGDGQSTVADIFDFLSAWFAGDPRANADGINGLTVADIFVFLSAWFAGN